MNRLLPLAACGALLFLQPGCVLMESAQEMGRQTKRMFTFRPNDYRDGTEDEGDPWGYVGEEARGNRAIQHNPEAAWFRNLLTSPKARHIENNLGFQ